MIFFLLIYLPQRDCSNCLVCFKVDIWNKTDTLVGTLRAATLATPFETPPQTNAGGISSQLKLIARLIAIRNERGNGINRDVFYADMGGEFAPLRVFRCSHLSLKNSNVLIQSFLYLPGFDSHFKVKTVFENKIPSLNHAVATFWAEMKAQGLENNIVVVQGSEFGRTVCNCSFLQSIFAAVLLTHAI